MSPIVPLAPALVQAAQSRRPQGALETLPPWVMTTGWVLVAVLFVATILVWSVSRLRAAAQNQRRREEEAAARFEQATLAAFAQSESPQASPEAAEKQSGATEAPAGEPTGTEAPPAVAAPNRLPSDDDPVEVAIRRFAQAGILSRREEVVLAPGESPVAFLTLESGRQVIVLPPGIDMAQARGPLRAADMVVLTDPAGEALVCENLGDWFTDKIFSPPA